MQERTCFIAAYLDGLYSMTELCQRFHISRKTGYKWRERFLEQGPGPLVIIDDQHGCHSLFPGAGLHRASGECNM